jgi:NAD+ kinase
MPPPVPARFPRIALVGRHGSPDAAGPLARLAQMLRKRGHDVFVEGDTAQWAPLPDSPVLAPAELGTRVDAVIVLGGDGTMLSIARRLAPAEVPLIGINLGRLGFLTDIPLARMEPAVASMLDGRYVEEQRTLIAVRVERGGGGAQASALSLNDVVVNRGALGTLIEYAIEIDGRFVFAMRADGVIVATPTGSTAYALSAGGPIIAPEVPAFALVPVAPHALTHRPIAVPDHATIAITVQQGKDASVHCDGQAHFELAEGDRVVLTRAASRARFLHPEGHDYFAMLREKLHWSETPERLRRDGGKKTD